MVRRGSAVRVVARRFGVSPWRVQYWVARAGKTRLDRVDWSDHRVRGHRPANRTTPALEAQILRVRDRLAQHSILGEYGAATIFRVLQDEGSRPPSIRTIGRVLVRQGVVGPHGRVRRPAPPPGWYLPPVTRGDAELDLVDFIEDLKLQDGPLLQVLTAVSLHGGLPGAWPARSATTTLVLRCLGQHWRRVGLPTFAQFDNDTRFQGPHQHRDAVGRVIRQCVRLGVTPVFVPPRELGLQNPIEHFNGLFQTKVWRRIRFTSLPGFQRYTRRYLAALCLRRAQRIQQAPPRPVLGSQPPATQLIYLRRCTERGTISVLGRAWTVDRAWAHRLVRTEIDLVRGELACFGVRRSDPTTQPLLRTHHYELRLS